MAGNCLSTLDTLVGVARCVLEGAVGLAVVGQSNKETLKIEVGDSAAESISFSSEEVFFAKFDVIEVDIAARVHAQAQLVQGFLGNARQGHIDKPFGVGVHVVAIASHNNQVGHVLGGSNKGLVTVQIDLTVLTGVGRAHVIPR